MVIQHNMPALNAYNRLTSTNNMLKKNQEKLSSGFRVNRAGDDAAGLAISEKMRARIRGLNTALRNCGDGISLVQTAEGALQSVHSILHRMDEIAVQSSNGSYDDPVDRSALQLEVSQLMDEINQIAESTTFNTVNLLDGSLSRSGIISVGPAKTGNLSVQGAPVGPLVYVYDEAVHDVDAVQTPAGSSTAAGYDALKTALKNQMVPQAVKAITSNFSDTFGYLNGSSIGIGLELYSNVGSSTLASVSIGAAGTLTDIDLTYKLSVNMASLDMDASGNLTAESRQELESTIAHEMMHALMDEAHTAGMLGRDEDFKAIAEFPDWFVEGAAQAAGGARDWVNSIGINANTSEADITNILGSGSHRLNSGSTSSEYATGYLAVLYLGYLASGSMTSNGLTEGVDAVLRELKAGSSLDTVISDLTGCTNTSDFENKFAAMGAGFVADLMDAVGSGRGALAANSLTQTDILPDSNLSNSLFELDTEHTEVENDYPDGYNVITGGGLSNTGVSPDGSTPTTGGLQPGGSGSVPTPDPDPPTPDPPDPPDPDDPDPPNDPDPNPSGPTDPDDPTTPDPESPELHKDLKGLWIQAGSYTKDGVIIYIDSVSTTSLGIDGVDVSTQEGANGAIDIIQRAVNKVSYQRADLGAYQNRIEHKISNLTATTENLTATESYIRDTDMANEMAAYMKNQILLQAGNSMLAQANLSHQKVLSLLS